MSLSREPNMREWLESLRARNDEQIKAGNSPPFTTMPSYSQITTWLLDVQSENERLRVDVTRLIVEKEKLVTDQKAYRDEMLRRALEIERLGNERDALREEKQKEVAAFNELLKDENQEARRMEALIAELKIIIEGQNETLAKHAQETEYRNKITAELIEQRDKLKEQIVEKDKIIFKLNEQKEVIAKQTIDRMQTLIEKHKVERDKLSGRVGALQHSNNELGRKYQITMNRYNKLLERVKKMEMSTKLKVPGLEDASGEMKPMVVSQVWDEKNPTDIGLLKNCTFSPPTEPSSEPKRGEFVTSPPAPLTYAQLTEWIEQLRKTIDMLQFNLEHQTNVRKAKEEELAELRKTVYELQKATRDIEYEYMEPARSGKDFVTYFAFEARSPKDTPTGRRRISF